MADETSPTTVVTDTATNPTQADAHRARAAKLGRVGLWSSVLEASEPSAAADTVAELEAQGWGAYWFGESYGREAFTQAALLLGATTTMQIGTGIASIWARDPFAARSAAQTLTATSGGRFVLGLGVSHQPLVERLRGGSYQRPVSALKEFLTAYDSARVASWEGRVPAAPVVVAALGPRALEVARAHSDGVHPYLVTAEQTAQIREAVGPEKLVAVELGAILSEDRETVLGRGHAHLEVYSGLPNYRNSWLRGGFDDSDLIRGGSDRLLDALVVSGDEAAIRARVEEYLAAGADHVCVQVLGADPGAAPTADWARLAPALTELNR